MTPPFALSPLLTDDEKAIARHWGNLTPELAKVAIVRARELDDATIATLAAEGERRATAKSDPERDTVRVEAPLGYLAIAEHYRRLTTRPHDARQSRCVEGRPRTARGARVCHIGPVAPCWSIVDDLPPSPVCNNSLIYALFGLRAPR